MKTSFSTSIVMRQRALVSACCFAVLVVLTNGAISQEAETHVESSVDQAKVVRAIYDATKTAKTVKDYTAFLNQCEEALAGDLNAENREYVISLRGWALNRKGEKHFELAAQLKRIGNLQHESEMKKALEDFDAAIVAAPERHRSWMSRGIAHIANDNLEGAILDFTKVTQLKADEPNAWFNRAEALYERGNYEHAIRDYDVALRLNSTDAQAMAGRGLAALKLKQFVDAQTDFDQVIALCPKNDAAYINRGDLHQATGEWKLAESDYQQAVKFKETAVGCQRLAWLKATCPDVDIRDSTLARKMIDRSIVLGGDTKLHLETLAATEAASGDFDAAKLTQQKVIGLVNLEENGDAVPSQARLALYEKSEPYVQMLDEKQEEVTPKRDKATAPVLSAPAETEELPDGDAPSN